MTMYEYRARCVRVVDGDTVDLQVDLGFHLKADLRFRLLGVDTPEIYRPSSPQEKERAKAAKLYVEQLLLEDTKGQDWPLTIHTEKADSFGRWLARVYVEVDGSQCDVSTMLIEEGLGEPYKK